MKSELEIIEFMESSSKDLSRINAQLANHESRKRQIKSSSPFQLWKPTHIGSLAGLCVPPALFWILSPLLGIEWALVILFAMIWGLLAGLFFAIRASVKLTTHDLANKKASREVHDAQHARELEELDFKLQTLKGKRLHLIKTRMELEVEFKKQASGGLQIAQDASTRGGLDLHDE